MVTIQLPQHSSMSRHSFCVMGKEYEKSIYKIHILLSFIAYNHISIIDIHIFSFTTKSLFYNKVVTRSISFLIIPNISEFLRILNPSPVK